MKDEIISKLECFKDPLFKFDTTKRKWTYDDNVLQSVTKLLETFHEPFDLEGKSLKKAEQLGISQDEVKKMWQDTNDKSNYIGKLIHQWIEDYYNQKWSPLPNDPDLIHRINKFNKIFCKQLHKLEPVKFEVKVFSKEWKITGVFDALFIKDDKLYIIDWKTNGKFTDDIHKDGRWEKMLPPFDEFYKNHHTEYSIQLCLYSMILKQWGIDVAGALIVYIGPDDDDARIVPCKNMMPYIQQYFDNKKDSL
jgi:ATP-dependent exoDNAse (exonuclease V) beta subunit